MVRKVAEENVEQQCLTEQACERLVNVEQATCLRFTQGSAGQ